MIALKIYRKRYRTEGLGESSTHRRISDQDPKAKGLVGFGGSFECEGHICLALERHGCSLDLWVDQGALAEATVRRASLQLLEAIGTLHGAGYAHTDVKVGNILYEPETGEFRLTDLGSARRNLRQGTLLGSREYTAPEVLIGAPLTRAVDLLSLGCCLFEMLTERVLFDPRSVAEKKYVEFDARAGIEPGPAAQEDARLESAEQFEPGSILGGRYRLGEILGQGRFATVWTAEPLEGASPLLPPHLTETVRCHEDDIPSSVEIADEWREKKGADDLLDLALNYELAVLMTRLCGPFPMSMLDRARYRRSYFEPDGALRFRPVIRRDSIRNRLRRQSSLPPESLESIADFLSRLLEIDPTRRIGVSDALRHPWLSGKRTAAEIKTHEPFRVGRPCRAGSP